MPAVNLTSATRRGARHDQHDQHDRPAVRDVGPSSQQADPHATTQLTENLRPRPAVRAARLQEPDIPVGIGVPIANVVQGVAGIGLVTLSVPTVATCLNAASGSFQAAHRYVRGDATWMAHAQAAAAPALFCITAAGGLYSAHQLAASYLQVQARRAAQAQARVPLIRAVRAHELGITEECLNSAIMMVTMRDAESDADSDEDTSPPEMTEWERTVLSEDLMYLVTAERSRLPPELWRAASGAGNACTLVNNLLAAARRRASEGDSASSAG
ncbi:type III secretion system effector XopAV [Xanthomonas arboricola]|uniref:type III secretion system effector XopAV n=1 Tax=Xanthomonas arboricola TaxID=56448 RepID=UPI003D18F713